MSSIAPTSYLLRANSLTRLRRYRAGYAISRSIDARLALAVLDAAFVGRWPPKGCIHHSDRGSQVRGRCLPQAPPSARLVGSMGWRGNPYDNAKAESFMKTLKVEAVHLMAY